MLEIKNADHKIFRRSLHVFKLPGSFLTVLFARWYLDRYQGRYRAARVLFAVDLILLAFVAALFLFSVSELLPRTRLVAPVSIRARAPALISGDTATFSFTVRNNTRSLVDAVVVMLRLPRGFEITDAVPATFDRRTATFTLGVLTPGAVREMSVQGLFIGEPGTDGAVSAVASYTTRGQEQTIPYTFNFPLRKSALTAVWNAPHEVAVGGEAPFVISYGHAGSVPVLGAVFGAEIIPARIADIRFDTPEAPLARTGPLPSGVHGEVRGRILGRSTGSASIKITVQYETPAGLIRQRTIEEPLTVTGGGLVLGLAPQFPESTTIAPGGALPLTLHIAYSGSVPLMNPELTITASPFGTVKTSPLGLETLVPGTQIDHPAVLELPGSIPPAERGAHTITLGAVLEAAAGATKAAAPSLAVAVSSALHLTAEARYYSPEGEQLGRGPLPPEVGEATTLWLMIRASSTPNPVRGGQLEIRLSPNTRYDNRYTTNRGTLSPPRISASGRILLFTIPDIQPDAPLQVSLPVTITPPAGSAGTALPLLDGVVFSGDDTFVPGQKVGTAVDHVTIDIKSTR